MEIQEKRNRMESYFLEQKKLLQNISLSNYSETISEIRKLELQKEIIKDIPTTKRA